MSISLSSRLYIGFSAAIAIVIGIGMLSFITTQKRAQQQNWVIHAYDAINNIEHLQTILVDMETGRRGYRSTNDTSFLSPYFSGLKELPAVQQQLNSLSVAPAEQAQLAQLNTSITMLLSFWTSLPTHTATLDISKRLAITSNEKQLMDVIRKNSSDFAAAEKKLLAARTADYNRLLGYSKYITLFGVIIILTIITTLCAYIIRTIRSKDATRRELRKNNSKLQQAIAEKETINKQLERFSYVVAHDLKAPLNNSIALLGFLQEDAQIQQRDDLKQYVNLLTESSNHMGNMIASMLQYSLKGAKDQGTETVDSYRLVTSVINHLHLPGHISVEVSDKLPQLSANKVKLEQVFQNLIGNAIKYNNKPKGLIKIGVQEVNGHYEFFVNDNGIGIRPEDHDRIFNLFETTNNIATGDTSTGVGLNLVKTLVEEQGGNIHLTSQHNQGATFYFSWKK